MGDDLYMDAHMLYPQSYASKFINQAIRTESRVENVNTRITHAVVGIMTEAVEYMQHTDHVNAREEIGDLLWYVAILADELHADLSTWLEIAVEKESKAVWRAKSANLIVKAGDLADTFKKREFYGKDKTYTDPVTELLAVVIQLCFRHETTIQSEMQRVIAKLRTRYPEKFDSHLADKRNLDAERKTLEDHG